MGFQPTMGRGEQGDAEEEWVEEGEEIEIEEEVRSRMTFSFVLWWSGLSFYQLFLFFSFSFLLLRVTSVYVFKAFVSDFLFCFLLFALSICS